MNKLLLICFMLIISAGFVSANSPIANWKFNEASGNTAIDSAGINNLEIVNAVHADGILGNALDFLGDGWAYLDSSDKLDISSAITIEAWINPDSYSQAWQSTILSDRKNKVMDNYPDGSWSDVLSNYQFLICPSNNSPLINEESLAICKSKGQGTLVFTFWAGDSAFSAYSDETILLNQWTHVAATYDGNSIKLYINGEPAGSNAATGNIDSHPEATLTIGKMDFDVNSPNNANTGLPSYPEIQNLFNGKIDEVAIYNYALTDEEIKEHYNPSDITPPGSVSNLALVSKSTSTLHWKWDNPSDSDFAYSIIHLNGIKAAETSNDFYIAKNLSSDAEYTITVHTADFSGNVNDTDVSDTEKTDKKTVIVSDRDSKKKVFQDEEPVSEITKIVKHGSWAENESAPVMLNKAVSSFSWMWMLVLLLILLIILALLMIAYVLKSRR